MDCILATWESTLTELSVPGPQVNQHDTKRMRKSAINNTCMRVTA